MLAEVASPQPGRGRQPARNEFAGSQAARVLSKPPRRGQGSWGRLSPLRASVSPLSGSSSAAGDAGTSQPGSSAGPGVLLPDPQLGVEVAAGGHGRVELVAPIALALLLGKPQRQHSRGTPVCACTPGVSRHPQPAVAPKPPLQQGTGTGGTAPGAAPLASTRLQPGCSQGRHPAASSGCPGRPSQRCQGVGQAWPRGGRWRCHRQPR
ncbi:PREDICTED: uncharacterized protein LOC104019621 [Nipponia nippon]|uniref:uncharacterized protein LOC104019621 n=1 Tax=Nipponia nippon TaxID=128390 RepID=UPI0005109C25|nr:PREDICTED: uncharacterized protein LOC104019621 [Nipponia nippon]